MSSKKIAVILAGCGHRDGSEIHEATLTLWAIHKNGAEHRCFAPNVWQHHVLNHLSGEEMAEQRNVLVESARIARGKIQDLSLFEADAVDGLIIPGGVGAAKNLCTYAFAGSECSVDKDVEHAVRSMHRAGKPIGALCISPVVLAKVLGNVAVTLGQDGEDAENVVRMGARHVSTWHGEVAIDQANKVVTTPCYMLDARIDQIGEGADSLVKAMLKLMQSSNPA